MGINRDGQTIGSKLRAFLTSYCENTAVKGGGENRRVKERETKILYLYKR